MKRIMIIDDDVVHLRSCARLLRLDSFDVVTASGGREALRLLAKNPVDLVITDVLMPDKEGVETIMELRRVQPGLKVIAMSGGGSVSAEQCLQICENCGAVGTLRKPFTREQLVFAIHQAGSDPILRSARLG